MTGSCARPAHRGRGHACGLCCLPRSVLNPKERGALVGRSGFRLERGWAGHEAEGDVRGQGPEPTGRGCSATLPMCSEDPGGSRRSMGPPPLAGRSGQTVPRDGGAAAPGERGASAAAGPSGPTAGRFSPGGGSAPGGHLWSLDPGHGVPRLGGGAAVPLTPPGCQDARWGLLAPSVSGAEGGDRDRGETAKREICGSLLGVDSTSVRGGCVIL